MGEGRVSSLKSGSGIVSGLRGSVTDFSSVVGPEVTEVAGVGITSPARTGLRAVVRCCEEAGWCYLGMSCCSYVVYDRDMIMNIPARYRCLEESM